MKTTHRLFWLSPELPLQFCLHVTLGWARHGCKRDVCDLHLVLSLSQCQSLRVFQIYDDASHEAETPQWTPPILCSSCIHSWCNIVLLRTQTNHVVCCAQVLGLKKNSLRFSKNPIDILYQTVIGLIMPTMEARFVHPACFAFCRISKVLIFPEKCQCYEVPPRFTPSSALRHQRTESSESLLEDCAQVENNAAALSYAAISPAAKKPRPSL